MQFFVLFIKSPSGVNFLTKNIDVPYSGAFWSMSLYTKPPLFVGGSSGLVYRGMLQIICELEHAPLSET